MKHKIFFFISALTAVSSAQADIVQAEQALRKGAAAEALLSLSGVADSPELHYYKGRALAELKHYEQAVAEFSRIEETHSLYPFAAKGIIYCARRCKDPISVLAPLTLSSNPQIATMAQAVQVEVELNAGKQVTLAQLQETCNKHNIDMTGCLLLMEAEQLRRAGNYTEAMAKCRRAEEVAPALQRDYSRILLGEIYYDKEREAGDDEGKGEETLLKFISSYPESALMEEAFRRLDKRAAFSTSKYAIRKLEEWARDGSAIYRALLASSIMQREALYTHANKELGELVANRATGINPEYLPVTVRLNNEQARYLIINNQQSEATTCTERIPEGKRDAYTLFYKARTLPATDPLATELYLKSAECAPPALQEIAFSNALYCAEVSENEQVVQQLLTRNLPLPAARAVKLTYAGLNLRKAPSTSRQILEEVLKMQPTEIQKVEAVLQLTQLDIDENDTSTALARLSKYSHEERKTWPNEQVMRYYGLFLHALECDQDVGRATVAHKPFLLNALESTGREDVRIAITLKLAKIYSEEGNHRDALTLLEELANNTTDKNLKARALMLAGRESTQCMTLPAVTKGAALFEAASKIDSPYKFRAGILNTAVLFRINDAAKGELKINRIIREIEAEREATPGSTHLAEEYAFALTVRADIESIPGTPDALKKAIATNEQVFKIPGLTQEWHSRAYLQQAIFCTRVDWNERALLNYKNIITNLPATAKQASPDKAYILCLSGTGAIACLLKMQKWAEAADMADSISNHPIGQVFSEKTKHFKEWARAIRKIHFLPMKEEID